MSSLGYLAAVNVVIWVGLFAYLWRLDRRISERERGTMKKGYWVAAALTLAFVGFGLTAFQKTLTPYLTFDEAQQGPGRRPGHGRPRQAERPLRHRPSRSSPSTSRRRAAAACRSSTAASSPATSRTPSRSSRSAATSDGRIEAEKLLVKCPSKYQGAEVEKAYASQPGPGQDLLMYFWPGVAAIWGALFAGLASAVTYLRVDRGRRDLLPLARTPYAAFATSRRRGRRDPDDAPPAAPLRRLLRQLLLEPATCRSTS